MMVMRCQLGMMVTRILESWTEARKKEIVDRMAARKTELMDHVVLSDYDLTLWRVPVNKDFYPSGVLFSVAINSEQHDPHDEKEQHTHFPGSSLRHLPFTSIKSVLQKWIGDYGQLAIGSVERHKLHAYKRMLEKSGFKIEPMFSDNFDYGFFVS